MVVFWRDQWMVDDICNSLEFISVMISDLVIDWFEMEQIPKSIFLEFLTIVMIVEKQLPSFTFFNTFLKHSIGKNYISSRKNLEKWILDRLIISGLYHEKRIVICLILIFLVF